MFIYWKEEAEKRKWKLMKDTEEERLKAINKGAMFFTWVSFSKPFKGKGHSEPIRIGDLPLDFDDKANPENALQDMKTLCLVHLPEFFDVDPYDIKFYCSGEKGFHAVLPKEMFVLEKGDPYIPLIYKKIVADWIKRFNLTTLDLSLYAMGKGKMLRIENVKRSNGKYKVPLTLEEVQNLSIDNLLKLSEEKRVI
jgi:hypothetical protein